MHAQINVLLYALGAVVIVSSNLLGYIHLVHAANLCLQPQPVYEL